TPWLFFATKNGAIVSQHYDGSTAQWLPSAGNTCAAAAGALVAGGGGTTAEDPAAAVFNIGSTPYLWVFYHDTTHNCLRGLLSPDGINWSETYPTGAASHCIDGGGSSGNTGQ